MRNILKTKKGGSRTYYCVNSAIVALSESERPSSRFAILTTIVMDCGVQSFEK